jgi:hypothetical protein
MEHVLAPITRGLRVVLTYNLVRVGDAGPVPQPPCSFYTPEATEAVQSALRQWEEARSDESHPFLAYALEHK